MTQTRPTAEPPTAPTASAIGEKDPWPALFALCLGFFMILVDSTIVSVATPAIIEDFDAGVNAVVWVTSAYLLAYAVPVLITGRLGDRFGPKRLYLSGLTVFTLASLWCGLTDSIEGLIVARVVQGLGAAMMTPQTMAIITRIFPAARRGKAMSLWGATAGVATLVGPILGGILVDALGWEWIFFINIPVGIIGFVLAWRLVPTLSTSTHRFDWLGVALSGAGMFLLVFGIQEGNQYDWGTITGEITVWRMIVLGLVVFTAFVVWQRLNRQEPLVPLALFRDRNFSLANVAITTMGFAMTAMAIPLMLYAQLVRGLSPSKAALLLVPMALMTLGLANLVGKLTDTIHPRLLTSVGFTAIITSLAWLSSVMTPDSAVWEILLPMALLGFGNAFVWSPNSATANRNLPLHQAGAGAGVYNATRQVGAVLGAAGIAVLIDARLAAQGLATSFTPEGGGSRLPEVAQGPFADAMAQAMLLPPAVLVLGLAAALCFQRPQHEGFVRR
ncbi:DHA2 family efflux MFS transporter permease subunit [Nocardioides sp. cx-173]|uniref:DHA2 family efflux MFS transporter permease subunit n=1 Tax=Nocardioides sp. cx-173 TaxID=2898796 RepID=UPI001E36225B|nr:DHA2 family efflux MFS transporter permease subunit [Nocardioides sp. cx-173]UGB41572.1 DHA2 family efflux MFS transporter permease subunit [Nocardioides sp. cx-173]